jgi:hypothetical protein
VLRDRPVRAFTAGSLRIVVANARASLEFKESQKYGEGVTHKKRYREWNQGNLLQVLGFFLPQRITGNYFVIVA